MKAIIQAEVELEHGDIVEYRTRGIYKTGQIIALLEEQESVVVLDGKNKVATVKTRQITQVNPD